MKPHRPPLPPFHPPFLLLVLLFLLPPARAASGDCPKHCSCSSPESIFCFTRRDASVPLGLPPSTKQLYLFQNGIEVLGPEDFAGLGGLQMLDLSQNKLSQLPDGAFRPLADLRNLDLSNNQLERVSQDSFAGLGLLERLYLYNNRIQSIHPAAFQGLGQLLELKLQGNRLTSLPALRMPKLLLLDLSYNQVPPPGPDDFQTPNLESLKMAGLGLRELDPELLAGLGNLHDLDVSQNQLQAVPPALGEVRGLIRLGLAGNPVGQLRPEDFQNLEELQELDVSNMNLQGFPAGLGRLLPRLQQLTAAENPFNCLCPLAWFPGWLREGGLRLGRTEETRCHFPPLNAGKVLERLEHRDFGCPTTTTVTTTTVTTSTTKAPRVTTAPRRLTPAVAPPPPSESPFSAETDSDPPPVAPPVPTGGDGDSEPHLKEPPCPPNICLNGGTCLRDRHGHLGCICPRGAWGTYCENEEEPPPPPPAPPQETHTVAVAMTPDISSGQVTSTTILLDLHRYIRTRPYLRGIRLTYRNLSGPDRRPMQLSVPASYPEYTLRGLRPNSTYSICAGPLGELGQADTSCTEARTAGQQLPVARVMDGQLTSKLVPALAVLLLLVLVAAAVGVVCYLRRRRAKAHSDDAGGDEPSTLELEGVKACLDNGTLPQKQPVELQPPPPTALHAGVEYEVPLMQAHCTSNNNMASLKPSYF
ncbi:LOW QUALITY PROTEIN: vasorin b [Anguilla anguilla]|uniref:LOW QUALITY PROTEIN: vasorin b n=1 Tax=Anguilla anguilla TaxID=7936 RepID=UPI0015AAB6EE|nr:LOW QUALITY PROTEIN: vasorin b [Anguilla anguilla]